MLFPGLAHKNFSHDSLFPLFCLLLLVKCKGDQGPRIGNLIFLVTPLASGDAYGPFLKMF